MSPPPPAPDHILIFTKYPAPSFAKTRLIPAVGPTRAAAISRALSDRIIATVRLLVARTPHLVSSIHYAAPAPLSLSDPHVRAWLRPSSAAPVPRERLLPQVPGDLGARLTAAFVAAFAAGAARVVVVGADIPEVDTACIADAFARLTHADVVVGPAADGGYYLLGMRAWREELFRDIPWSTDKVFDTTMRRAREGGMRVVELGVLRDVDLPEDVPYFEEVIARPVR